MTPPRRALLATSLLALGACGVAPEPTKAPPNILFVMIDDLGWKDIRPQGNPAFVTPHLDRLAADGMRFTDFYAAAPVCSPTRAACITGLAPARLKVTNHVPDRWSFYDAPKSASAEGEPRRGRAWGPGRSAHALDPATTTIAERLRDRGYRTGFVGKWHLAGPDWRTTDVALFPESHGFDVNVAGNAMGGPGRFFGPIAMPNYRAGGEGDYLPDLLADEAAVFVAAARTDARPFFLCLWTYTVHYPIEAPDELLAKYTDAREADGSVTRPDMPTRYRAMVEGMDRAVGRVLRALDEAGVADDTLVVFTSDNGQMPGSSVADPLRDAKGYLHEGGIRVPLIVRWPGRVPAGTVTNTPAISMDFAPTFLAAAGADVPRDEFDGVSLLPTLSGDGAVARDALFWHYPHYAYHGDNHLGSAVRVGDLKYIHHYDDDAHELYDLAADIGERDNLVAARPADAARLRARLERWLASTDAALPRRYEQIPADELPGQKRAQTTAR